MSPFRTESTSTMSTTRISTERMATTSMSVNRPSTPRTGGTITPIARAVGMWLSRTVTTSTTSTTATGTPHTTGTGTSTEWVMVRRIFAEYLDGNGDRAIAHGLNVDGVPCASARRPDQIAAVSGTGGSGTRSGRFWRIPAIPATRFGRWSKHETLLDPDDVAAGHVTRFAGRIRTGSCRPASPVQESAVDGPFPRPARVTNRGWR
jgi:hypothetical protein